MPNWRAGLNGLLVADVNDVRMTIEAPARFIGLFQFNVLRRQHGEGSPFALVSAGIGGSLAEAMASAGAAAATVTPLELPEP